MPLVSVDCGKKTGPRQFWPGKLGVDRKRGFGRFWPKKMVLVDFVREKLVFVDFGWRNWGLTKKNWFQSILARKTGF